MFILFMIGCEYCGTDYVSTKISQEWLETHATPIGDGKWAVNNTEHPCIIYPDNDKVVTREIMEKCCDENGCRFESPTIEGEIITK